MLKSLLLTVLIIHAAWHSVWLSVGYSAWASAASPPRMIAQSNGARQMHLVELYSSEGCSSCPPAEEWFSTLRASSNLWKTFVPIAFHVDYWDHLGWTDRYSKGAFTARQRRYAHDWKLETVYTPALVLDGRDWHKRESGDLSRVAEGPGTLKVEEIGPMKFRVTFESANSGNWHASGALLGNGLVTQVKAGENSGKTLTHDFVVLSIQENSLKRSQGHWISEFELTPKTDVKPKSFSVAFWITHAGDQAPLQAIGLDLN